MRKKVGIVKRLFTLLLIFLLSINSFAAIVSDNDGSAFITKAEFDALKNNFQTQINTYNTSIDSKIDGAIAAYLAGLTIGHTEELSLDPKCMYGFPLVMDSASQWNDINSAYYDVMRPQLRCTSYGLLTHWEFLGVQLGVVNPLGTPTWPKINTSAPATSERSFAAALSKAEYNCDYIVANINQVSKKTSDMRTHKVHGTTGTWNTRELQQSGTGYQSIFAVRDTDNNFATSAGLQMNATQTNASSRYLDFVGYTVKLNAGRTDVESVQKIPGPIFTKSILKFGCYGGARNSVAAGDLIPDGSYSPKSALVKYGSWCGWGSLWFGATGSSSTQNWGTPQVNNLVWETSGVRKRIYALDSNMPATADGGLALDVVAETDVNKQFFIKVNRNLAGGKQWQAVNWTGADRYLNPFYSGEFLLWPKMFAYTNPDIMPADGADFSQLPASLVYYTDSDGRKHYCDEGMFLQTLKKSGKVSISLVLSGASGTKVKVAFSKKPFDNNLVFATDLLYYTTQGATDITSKTTTGEIDYGETKFSIDESFNKGEDLYMYWWPAVDGKLVQLDTISEFSILVQD